MRKTSLEAIISILSNNPEANEIIEEIQKELSGRSERSEKRKDEFMKRREQEKELVRPIVEQVLVMAEKPLRAIDIWNARAETYEQYGITAAKLSSLLGMLAKDGAVAVEKFPKLTVYKSC